MSSEIVKSINSFWDGLTIKEDHLTIAADSLIMVYIYIILKASISDIFAQIRFINEYLTPQIKATKLGYCITTLEIAVSHINSLSKEELLMAGEPVVSDSDNFFNETARTPSVLWNEVRKSLTQSLRKSLSLSSRAVSLVIDPEADYIHERTSSYMRQSFTS